MSRTNKSLAEIDGGNGPPVHPSIWAALEEGVNLRPNHPAIIAMHQSGQHLSALVGPRNTTETSLKHLTWSYEQLRLGASRTASVLSSKGVQRGSKLVTMIPDCGEWCLLFWAAALMEVTLVPLDARLTEPSRKQDLKYFLETLEPSIVVVNDVDGTKAVDALFTELHLNPKAGICLNPTTDLNTPWTTFGNITTEATSLTPQYSPAPRPSDPSRVAIIIFTSGTSSGIPKGCPHTVTSFLHSSRCIANHDFLGRDMRAVMHWTNFRAIMNVMSLCLWRIGATAIIPSESFSAATTIAAIDEYQVTVMVCVPSMVYAIAKDQRYSKISISSLREISLAGDVITASLLRTTKNIFPESNVMARHGMTEGSAIFDFPVGTDFSVPLSAYGEIATIGTVQQDAKIRIVDDEGKVVERGVVGELHIAGLSVVRQYLGEVRPELFYREGETHWMVTGDKGLIDNDGWGYIVGRSKDIIKKSGVPIAPAGLEACLNVHIDCQVCY